MADFWARLTGTQADPRGWAVVIGAAAALLLVTSPRAWRLTRIAITIAHEGGHALASLLTGRRLQGIRLHADTSGETVSRGKRDGPGIVLTTIAGYPAPSLLGVGAAWLLAAHRMTLLLSLLLAALAVTLLAVRNWYGALAVLLTAGAVSAATWLAGSLTRAAFGYGVAWFLLIGGVRPVMELARSRSRATRRTAGRAGGRAAGRRQAGGRQAGVARRGPAATRSPGRNGASDADHLAWLTGVPGGVWVALFALISLAALALGARLLIPWPVHLPQVK